MVWNIILAVVIWHAAVFWATYGLITPLTIFRTGFPLIKVLAAKKLIDAPAARRDYTYCLVLWGIIDAIVILLMVIFANTWAWAGFATGVGIVLWIGVRQTGANDANKDDFLQGNARFVAAGKTEAFYLTVKYYPVPVTDEMVEAFVRQMQKTNT